MDTIRSDLIHTGISEIAATVPKGPGLEAPGGRNPQALWGQLRLELRAPVEAIIGSSKLLLGNAHGLGQAEYISNLSRIHSAGRQLLTIIDDLLDPNKFASGDVVFNLASLIANLHYIVRLPINDVIGCCETLLEDAAGRGRLDISADLKKIQSAAAYVLSYINEIIDFSKIDAGLKKSGATDSERLALIDSVVLSLRGLTQDSAAVSGYERGSILVVDDNAINRDLLSRFLERQGHAVQVATSGQKALDMIAADAFDLVLLDITMPGLNGYQVLRRLKNSATWRDLPVIMLSAWDEIDCVSRCLELGAEDYLPKPFNSVLLRNRVGDFLEKKAAARSRKRTATTVTRAQHRFGTSQPLSSPDLRQLPLG